MMNQINLYANSTHHIIIRRIATTQSMLLRPLFGTVDHRLQTGRLAHLALRLGSLATRQLLLFGPLLRLLHLFEDVLLERAYVWDLDHTALEALALRVLLGLFAHLALVLLDLLEDLVLLTAGQPVRLLGCGILRSKCCIYVAFISYVHSTYSSVPLAPFWVYSVCFNVQQQVEEGAPGAFLSC